MESVFLQNDAQMMVDYETIWPHVTATIFIHVFVVNCRQFHENGQFCNTNTILSTF